MTGLSDFEQHQLLGGARRAGEPESDRLVRVVAQIKADAVAEVVAAVEAVAAVLDEYAGSCDPAPYTNERALYERVCAALKATP